MISSATIVTGGFFVALILVAGAIFSHYQLKKDLEKTKKN
jgi:hypothetical protein|tara:strand:+ start:191 stop:310 length:120 start_codon:yes stop_codon:yes gene_type:complete